MDCVDDIKTQMTSKMTCEPKSSVSCVPQTTEVCTIGKIWNVLDFRRGVASKRIKQLPQNFVLFFSKMLILGHLPWFLKNPEGHLTALSKVNYWLEAAWDD